MKINISAPTWAEINLDNISYNLKNIKELLKEDTKICGVVKANAYSHGAVQISKFLQRENVVYTIKKKTFESRILSTYRNYFFRVGFFFRNSFFSDS